MNSVQANKNEKNQRRSVIRPNRQVFELSAKMQLTRTLISAKHVGGAVRVIFR